MIYDTSIFIFRRDLRLFDNTTLIAADKTTKNIIPIFIFDPHQLENRYASQNCIQFMIESLKDLDGQLRAIGSKLNCFYGKPWLVIDKLLRLNKIDAVYFNTDYTGYSKKRDTSVHKVCAKYKCELHTYEDLMLHPNGSIVTQTGKIYEKFTPFYTSAILHRVRLCDTHKLVHVASRSTLGKLNLHSISIDAIKFTKNHNLYVHGGRTNGKHTLRSMTQITDYENTHDYPIYDTTLLSAHNKFGTISIREVYTVFKKNHNDALIRQLYWRDFYYNQVYHNPQYFQMNVGKYGSIKWNTDNELLNKWKHGDTGVPIVDAGMRQLNETGWMHNRTRMIVSMYLTKILHIDWRIGEKYFRSKLVDYDITQNVMNWYWISGELPLSNPYFRIMNPYNQLIKYDHECRYVKKWVPKLENVACTDIRKNMIDKSKYVVTNMDILREMRKSIRQYAKHR